MAVFLRSKTVHTFDYRVAKARLVWAFWGYLDFNGKEKSVKKISNHKVSLIDK